MIIEIPVSVGELFDKITILRIKMEKGIGGVANELDYLESKIPEIPYYVDVYVKMLHNINSILWNIEDEKRACEQSQTFDQRFIELARCVYIFNDERARIKKRINVLTGSDILEFKQHPEY